MAQGRVTATGLNLRDAPQGAIIGQLHQGDRVSILDSKDGWMSVSASIAGAAKTGWVSAQFIAPLGPPPADDPTRPVTVAGAKAIGPDGRSFASAHGPGFVTFGMTTLARWLADDPSDLALSPSVIRVVQAVSHNEGKLEAVNSYDNSFLSFGMFQWTAGAADHVGELAGLLDLIGRRSTAVFQDCFGRYGLGVAGGFLTLSGAPLKAAADKEQLRAAEWAYRFWRAGQDATVRACELELAAARIPGFLRLAVSGHSVGDWLSSEYGVALVLDEHVNRPGHVPGTLRTAIQEMGQGADPANWADDEEAALIERYIAARNATSMTDPAQRAIAIGDCVHAGELSDHRGSFVPTLAATPSV